MIKKFVRTGLAVALPMALAACSAIDFGQDRIQYETSDSRAPLEIPPDLSSVPGSDRYTVPSRPQTVWASQQAQADASASNGTPANMVLLPQGEVAKIVREGNDRWIHVNMTPEMVWPIMQDFWTTVGLSLSRQDATTGVMETNWAENRAKLPQDIIRKTIGKVFDALYSTGERDKFRTRLERNSDGTTDIFISHRGAQEEIVGVNRDTTMWTARASDPELEAEFLSRLMVQLSDMNQKEKARARAIAERKTVVLPSRATLVKGNNSSKVVVDETFDRTWRRVGLALDRVGFTVEDRDRSKGLYYVRYVDQDSEAKNTPENEKGFLSNLFSFSTSEKQIERYQISIQETGGKSEISVQDSKGLPETTSTGRKIMNLMYEQLR